MEPEKFKAGPLTMAAVFKPNGLANLSDMQAVLDATEAALRIAAIAQPLILLQLEEAHKAGYATGYRDGVDDPTDTVDDGGYVDLHAQGEAWDNYRDVSLSIRVPEGVASIADVDLLRRAVRGLCVKPSAKGRRIPLWKAVMSRFQLGSTYAWQLCERFGLSGDVEVKP